MQHENRPENPAELWRAAYNARATRLRPILINNGFQYRSQMVAGETFKPGRRYYWLCVVRGRTTADDQPKLISVPPTIHNQLINMNLGTSIQVPMRWYLRFLYWLCRVPIPKVSIFDPIYGRDIVLHSESGTVPRCHLKFGDFRPLGTPVQMEEWSKHDYLLDVEYPLSDKPEETLGPYSM